MGYEVVAQEIGAREKGTGVVVLGRQKIDLWIERGQMWHMANGGL